MASESNGHVIVDVTLPWKVSVVTPTCLGPIISQNDSGDTDSVIHVQWSTYRKWHIGYRMVRFSMTSRDLIGQGRAPDILECKYRKPLQIRARFQWTTKRKWHMANLMVTWCPNPWCHVTLKSQVRNPNMFGVLPSSLSPLTLPASLPSYPPPFLSLCPFRLPFPLPHPSSVHPKYFPSPLPYSSYFPFPSFSALAYTFKYGYDSLNV